MKDKRKTKSQLIQELEQLRARTAELELIEQTYTDKILNDSGCGFRSLFENAPIGIGIMNFEGQFLAGNHTLAQIAGSSTTDELLLIKFRELFQNPVEYSLFWQQFNQEGTITGKEVNLKRQDGSAIDVKITIHPLKFQGRDVLLTLIEEMTSYKQAEKALEERMRFERLVSRISTQFINLPTDEMDKVIIEGLRLIGEFFDVDRVAFAQYLNDKKVFQSSHVWLSKRFNEMSNEAINQTATVVSQTFPNLTAHILEKAALTIDQFDDIPTHWQEEREYWASIHIKSGVIVRLSVGGTLLGVLSLNSMQAPRQWADNVVPRLRILGEIFANALNRKQAEEEMKEREEFYEAIVENIPNMVFVKDAKALRFVRQNKASEELLGFSKDEFIGKTDYDFFPKAEADFFTRKDREVLQEGLLKDIPEETIQTKYKGQRILHTKKIPLFDKHGQPKYLLGISEDITEWKRAEAALRANLQFLETLLDTIPSPVFYQDRNGKYQGCNKAFIQLILGLPKEAIIGHSMFDLPEVIPPDLAARYHEQDQKLLNEPGFQFYESEVQCTDGLRRDFIFNRATYKDASGNIAGIIGVMLDISERKQAENRLRESEAKFRSIYEESPNGIELYDTNGKLIEVNRACLDILGVSNRTDIKEFDLFENHNLTPETKQQLRKGYSVRFETEYDFSKAKANHLFNTQKTGIIHLDLQITPLGESVNASSIGYLVHVQDITERKQAEQAILKERDNAQMYLDIAGVMILALDQNANITLINQKGCQILGYTQQEVIGKNWFTNFLPPREHKKVRDIFKHVLKGHITQNDFIENSVLTKTGEERIIEWHNIILKDATGKIIGSLSSGSDITERKRAENALRLNENRLNALYKLSQMADLSLQQLADYALAESVKLTNSKIGFLGFLNDNETEMTIHSWSRETPKNWQKTVRPRVYRIEDAGLWVEAVRQRKSIILNDNSQSTQSKKGCPLENVIIKRFISIPIFDGNNIVAVAAMGNKPEKYDDSDLRQLTLLMDGVWKFIQRKQAEEALRHSEAKFRNLAESLDEVVYRANPETFMVNYVNHAVEIIFGYSAEELLNASKFWEKAIHPEDKGHVITRINNARQKLQPIAHEYRIIRKDNIIRWVEDHLSWEKDPAGKPISVNGVIYDITERKRAEQEREKLEEQIRHAQKMKAIGILAGGVAHDFNNLLTAILGNAELLLDVIHSSDPMRLEIEEIKKAAERAATLTRQLLAFSRRQPLQKMVVDLNSIVLNIKNMLNRLIGEDIQLITHLEPKLRRNLADPGQIEQVIMNLTVNASDAMTYGGKLIIKTENVMLNEDDCQKLRDARPGRFTCLSVQDTGTGIDKKIIPQIFDPFFSTKGPGSGTGLGLSVVYGIVKQHEGWIDVESEIGRGSNFKVYLPVISIATEEECIEKISLFGLQGHGERILLVEDEEEVLNFASRALVKNGYHVTRATSTGEALEVFEKERGNFHLVFSDVVLPDQSGLQLVNELQLRKPELLVLLSSGYTEQKAQWSMIRDQGYRFLQKPYNLFELLQTVMDVLKNHPKHS